MGKKKIMVGGQAVIEGVMIKSPDYVTISVRTTKGKIVSKKEKIKKPKYNFLEWPFIRGTYNLFQMLLIGTKALVWSANIFSDEEEELSKGLLALTIALSISFVVLFFIVLPYTLTNWIGIREEYNPIFFNFIDGLIKVVLLVAYIVGISFMNDVKRLFQYHGAEHKSVYCYEAGKKLTIKNAMRFSTLHPRCGTSFIMLVFITSILFFSILPALVIYFYPSFLEKSFIFQKSILLPLRILIIPFIAGTAYELLKLGSKKPDNLIVKILVRPGIWLQLITTKDPDKKQIEVAIHSLRNCLRLEKL